MNDPIGHGHSPENGNGQQHPSWSNAMVRLLGGLMLIVTALTSLLTAIGKLDNELSDKGRQDLNHVLYSTRLIEFTRCRSLEGVPASLDAGSGGVKNDAVLDIPDEDFYHSVHAKEISGGRNCNFGNSYCTEDLD
ncbi:hypothetical protein HHL24_11365 [Paraburkholderia sp. RP-4-7]|uniref:Uncharacterized protein n=1 Tax=Paraburkholderia polaris TaxID=2728848 RepID=A0A848IAX1_9BURK|nr:hypothetical protein [Paraburkholderia polaris]NML98549.1 hypothetical protein [Paraburkholderia polaris]